MNENVPCVTVLIAARPGQADIKAVAGARGLRHPADKLEILIARGKQPSAQRNAALKAARGELIYFLDDDSVPDPGNLERAVGHFRKAGVEMVGGPNLCPPEAPELEQIFALVLASWLAFGPSRARYAPVGVVRATSEKELILCNLVARRDPLVALGGFNEALYPNEENALMDELQKRGGQLIYDPAVVVHRHPRASLAAFAKMLLTYGRGRAEQFRLHPTPGSALNFVPPLFLLYLVALVATPWAGGVLLAPLAVYVFTVLLQVAVLRAPVKSRSSAAVLARRLAIIPLIFLTHVLYGAGFWRGLFTSLKTPGQSSAMPAVILETISP